MHQEEIMKGNKLIAELMGGQVKEDDYGEIGVYCTNFPEWNKWQSFKTLKYHTSWDWLMPCVEKIEGMGFDSRIMRFPNERSCICDFVNEENFEVSFSRGFDTSKIQVVWGAVVDFILYFNQQKQSK